MTDTKTSAELADLLDSRAAQHDKMVMGNSMGLGYFSGNDARLMRDAATALRIPAPIADGVREAAQKVTDLHFVNPETKPNSPVSLAIEKLHVALAQPRSEVEK